MPFDDSNHTFYGLSFEEAVSRPAKPARKRRAPRAKKRTVNYRASSTEATLLKQDAIFTFLELAGEGATVRQIGEALGISRQLALYHVKKLAATGSLRLVSEPCAENGGIQFKCWREEHLARFYSRFARQLERRAA